MKITIEVDSLDDLKRFKQELTKLFGGSDVIHELYTIPIDVLTLTARSDNCLKLGGIHTIGALIENTGDNLYRNVPNLGPKSITEIKDMLAARGYPPLGSFKKSLSESAK